MTYNEDIARALCAQQQCDEDGVMCIVSRQAADEGAGLIRRLTASNDALRAEVERLREAQIRPDVLVSFLCDSLRRGGFDVSYIDLMRMYQDAGTCASWYIRQIASESETDSEDEGC